MLHASHFLALPSFRSVVIPTQLENLPTAANAKWLHLAISGSNHKRKCSQTRSTAQHVLAKLKKKKSWKECYTKSMRSDRRITSGCHVFYYNTPEYILGF
jgi:hypothetical protein